MNFLLSPVNISGVLSKKVKTRGIDPIPILLYAIFNTSIVVGFLYLLIDKLYEKKVALLCIGVYLLISILLGLIFGIVDQFIGINHSIPSNSE